MSDKSRHVFEILDVEEDKSLAEWSSESFDRMAFAEEVLGRLKPRQTRIALCRGLSRVRVEKGRLWPSDSLRWALLSIPPHASRRAITLGVLELCRGSSEIEPFVLDSLLGQLEG